MLRNVQCKKSGIEVAITIISKTSLAIISSGLLYFCNGSGILRPFVHVLVHIGY